MIETANQNSKNFAGRSDVEPRHAKHCFVVMPFGRTPEEERWFRGWYQTVIEPAVISCGYEPILSASEEHPAAINDEIRSHLVFDPMVVVDLGGIKPEDPPNPNVMYELGIRHAFGLPLVIMAWEGQRLPFDVSNQRAIMTRRDFMEIELTRQRLSKFIKAANEGRYYNPMESVGREAAIDATSLVLGEESLLAALASEVREMRDVITSRRTDSDSKWKRRLKIKSTLGKADRPILWGFAQSLGLNPTSWGHFLGASIAPEMHEEMKNWSIEEWKVYLAQRAPEFVVNESEKIDDAPKWSEDLLDRVALHLPPQPWPTGIHKRVSAELELPAKQVNAIIQELIRQRRFKHQKNGVIVDDSPSDQVAAK